MLLQLTEWRLLLFLSVSKGTGMNRSAAGNGEQRTANSEQQTLHSMA